MKIAYFDNAATTFPKPSSVYELADDFYRKNGANVGRGQYSLASQAASLVSNTRDLLLDLYDCKNKQVLFTSSATEALNKILLGVDLNPNSTVYLSPFEHNSVTRVVHSIERNTGINIEKLAFDRKTLTPNLEEIERSFSKKAPSLIISTHASNVCGAIVPIEKLFALSKEYGATTVVDMSQTAGLLKLNLSSENIDFAVFAGHKSLLGPFGVGGFICSKQATLKQVFYGGTGADSINQDTLTSLRERIEIGSMNIYAIAGLSASLDWIKNKGLSSVMFQEQKIAERTLQILRSYKNIKIVGEAMEADRIGVVSTLFDSYSPDEIGSVFNTRNVAVRTGLHCSPYAHEFLNTLPNGTVRLSVSCLTNEDDLGLLVDALDYIQHNS